MKDYGETYLVIYEGWDTGSEYIMNFRADSVEDAYKRFEKCYPDYYASCICREEDLPHQYAYLLLSDDD